MGIEQLENKGFAFLNIENLNTDRRQIVVVGTARGGTSLVAGALHHLGIFTGDKSNPPVFEDVSLSEAFESDDLDLAKKICDKYTKHHDVWSWKRPAALNYLDKVEIVIPNPFYIFVFKDIFAIANRNNISMQADICAGLNNALVDYQKIINFISVTDKPVMLVSAEKALQNKESFVDALIELNNGFRNFEPKKEASIDFITPNPKAYLDQTRLSKSVGIVDVLDKSHIFGWAKSVHHNRPVKIEIHVNKNLYAVITADQFREDLQHKGIHPDGKCAFSYSFEGDLIVPAQSLVEVKVQGDVENLSNGVKKF